MCVCVNRLSTILYLPLLRQNSYFLFSTHSAIYRPSIESLYLNAECIYSCAHTILPIDGTVRDFNQPTENTDSAIIESQSQLDDTHPDGALLATSRQERERERQARESQRGSAHESERERVREKGRKRESERDLSLGIG